MKDVIITTGALNCYGSRILTDGIDLGQYLKNPVLLWMHRRSTEPGAMPIGRMENLRTEGDRLIGTPVFDENDPFARQIADKWERGFLRMASAGIEILETSSDPALLLPGQTRETITRCRLEEVSIVDIGGNDEALQLYDGDGRKLTLAAGEEWREMPLLRSPLQTSPRWGGLAAGADKNTNFNNTNNNPMNKEQLELLGLQETATEQEVTDALRLLKQRADEAESLTLASISALVDGAVAERRITADKRDHFISLGRAAGIEALQTTLQLMQPAQKPTEVIGRTPSGTPGAKATYARLSEVPEADIPALKEENPAEYERLYQAEYFS